MAPTPFCFFVALYSWDTQQIAPIALLKKCSTNGNLWSDLLLCLSRYWYRLRIYRSQITFFEYHLTQIHVDCRQIYQRISSVKIQRFRKHISMVPPSPKPPSPCRIHMLHNAHANLSPHPSETPTLLQYQWHSWVQFVFSSGGGAKQRKIQFMGAKQRMIKYRLSWRYVWTQ